DPLHVKLQGLFAIGIEKIYRLGRWNEEQAGIVDLALGLEMQRRPRLIEGVRNMAIEIPILFRPDFRFRATPEGVALIDLAGLALDSDMDRELDMVRVFRNDGAQLAGIEIVTGIGAEMQDDVGAATSLLRRCQRELAFPVGGPEPGLRVASFLRQHLDLI